MIFTEVNTFYSIVSSAFKSLSLNKWRRDFLLEIFMLYLIIPGRINFTQMSRYSKSCEQRFRNQFKQKFDFMNYNASLIKPFVCSRTTISFDPSHIEKSGKKTPYLGSFWSGSDQCTKRGLEIAQIALIDIDLKQSFHLEAVQTVPAKTLKVACMSLVDWYAQTIIKRKEDLQKVSNIVVADAFFSKITFIQPLMNEGFHVISKLRDDANLRYKFTGEYAGKGRPPHLAGKVNIDNLNMKECVNAIVFTKKDADGGNTTLPDYGATVDSSHCGMLVYPAWKSMHGVTKIELKKPNGYRNSFVFYPLNYFLNL
jgi:hypothetical protein